MRQLVGLAALLGGLLVYALLMMRLGSTMVPEHWAAQALFYAVAGIAWVPAAARLTAWMQKRRRQPDQL
jgi:Protein of unknown function (DUF2842)